MSDFDDNIWKKTKENVQGLNHELDKELGIRKKIVKELPKIENQRDKENYEKFLKTYIKSRVKNILDVPDLKSFYDDMDKFKEALTQAGVKTFSLKDDSVLKDLNANFKSSIIDKALYEQQGGFLGTFQRGYYEKNKVLKDAMMLEQALLAHNFASDEERQNAYSYFAQVTNSRLEDVDSKIMEEKSKKISGYFNQTFDSILTGQKRFNDGMSQLAAQLGQHMVSNVANKMFEGFLTNAGKFLTGKNSGGGFLDTFFGIAKIFLLHSGGTIPRHHAGVSVPYSSYSLPGTQEQLAILKGGERVLSPAENVNYENASSSGASSGGIQILNFNIKAWDAKDVASYLKENSSLIQQITAQGIKNNQNGLRNIVQSV